MVVLFTCKSEEDPIKNEGTRVLTRSYIDFSEALMAGNSAFLGLIEPKFELIKAFMVVLINCKNDKDPIKNE